MGGILDCTKAVIIDDEPLQGLQIQPNPPNSQSSRLRHFNTAFDDLNNKLRSRGPEDEKLNQVRLFVYKWEIEDIDYYQSWDLSLNNIIPLELLKRQLILHIRKCFTDPALQANLRELPNTLGIVQDALPTLEGLSQLKSLMDEDLYCLIGPLLPSSVLKKDLSLELSNYIVYIQIQAKSKVSYFSHLTTGNNLMLRKAIDKLEMILNAIKNNPESCSILRPYYVLNIPESLKGVDALNAIKNLESQYGDSIQHVLDLIPKVVLILPEVIMKEDSGFTLYNNRICINKNYFLIDDEISLAKIVITIMHELAHCKRIRYYSNGGYFLYTPERIAGERVREAGNYLERHLFGGVVDFRKLDKNEEAAKRVLNLESYSSLANLEEMKTSMRPYLKPDELSQNVGRRDAGSREVGGCAMEKFRVPINEFRPNVSD